MLILFNNYNNNNNLLSLAINITYQNQYITSPTEKKINPNIILILIYLNEPKNILLNIHYITIDKSRQKYTHIYTHSELQKNNA